MSLGVCVGGVCRGGSAGRFCGVATSCCNLRGSGNHPPMEEWLSVLPHTHNLEATIRDFPLEMET